MYLGLVGKKLGMIRIYDKFEKSIPITLVKIFNSYIVKKNIFIFNKYNSFQITYNISYKKNRFTKPLLGHFIKNDFKFYGNLKEFFVNNYYYNVYNKHDFLPLNLFYINQKIKVTSFSIGKGYSGVIKKHNFKSSPASHGNSKSHNKPGSIGMNQDPGRVFLGKKMSGRLGGLKTTIVGLKIKNINFNYNIFYISGSIPGNNNNFVFVHPII